MSLKIQISQKEYSAYVIIYDIRAKVGLFYLESSSYQFLKFDFTFGFSKRIAHTCVLRPIERSYVPRKIETCKLPLIAIKRFPNSNIRLFKYNIYIYYTYIGLKIFKLVYSKNETNIFLNVRQVGNELRKHSPNYNQRHDHFIHE